MLFQTFCKNKLDWDTTLEGELLRQWTCLLEEFVTITEIRIPRCFLLFSQNFIVSQALSRFMDSVMHLFVPMWLWCICTLFMIMVR